MKKFIASVLLVAVIPVMAESLDLIPKPAKMIETTEVITIKSTAFLDDGTVPAITGYIVGLEGPPMGDYKVNITNCNGFKAPRFTLMTCNLKPYLEEIYDGANDMGVVSTAFTHNGLVDNVLGFYNCPDKMPSENYQVVVTNGKDRTLWNSMNCRIK